MKTQQESKLPKAKRDSLTLSARVRFIKTVSFAITAGIGLIIGCDHASAQNSSVIFSDDFESNTIDPGKYQPDAPFFEGGIGDIHAEPGDGVMHFVGTTTQQWWSGGTLRLVPTFTASEDSVVTISIDRVAEAGGTTGSRSALWILDETKTKYVLFADVKGEGNWHYNRNIGEDGDSPTGGGNDIAAFNGGTFDDLSLHRMKMVADGKTVKLFLDDQLGAEVKFPFQKVIFEFGSYARANNDHADTTWDNLKVEATAPKENVIFSDDFTSNTIDPVKYHPDAPFFEGGVGDIHAEPGDGVMHFVGTTTQQWWSGGTLQLVPTFTASDESVVTVSIDRVAEAGGTTGSRSALWILDETKTKYVLFADVKGEGNWHYNRNIGEDGDSPTGGGVDIAAFNGGTFDDLSLHRMKMVADGKTVKLFLDDQFGVEVKFPFQKVIFEFGSYARANNDHADTTWDNLKVTATGAATFVPTVVSTRPGTLSGDITLRIPAGLNAQNAVTVLVVSADPAIAVPEGGTAGSLNVVFPPGGANTATFKARGLALGGVQFTAEGAVPGGNQLSVVVVGDPTVQFTDDFAGAALDTVKWQTSNRSFEVGTGGFEVAQSGGTLNITGATETDYWPGASIITKKSFTATKDMNLVVDFDRVSIDPNKPDASASTGARTGVFLTSADHTKYILVAQNVGETGWEFNVAPGGTATGSGTAIPEFADLATDLGNHHLKLVFDGEGVDLYLDGRKGSRAAFSLNAGIFVELGAYARTIGDSVVGQFDNVKIENALPCTAVTPTEGISVTLDDTTKLGTVSIPRLLNDSTAVSVTITSLDKNIAVPTGSANGALTLNFAAGGPTTKTFGITPVGLGVTTFEVVTAPASCVSGPLKVEVISVPFVFLTDSFSGDSFDPALWTQSDLAFETGTPTPESSITITNGQIKFDVTALSANWPGLSLTTVNTFSAGPNTPLTFEIDRVLLDFVLVTGTAAKQRTGIWVKNPDGNFVFFSDFKAHDGGSFGWRYNAMIGNPDTDNPTGNGTNIPAFDGGTFDNQGNHRLKLVANGATVRLYLDGILGAEVPFPFTDGLSLTFGSYVLAGTDIVRGYFDNALITGGSKPPGAKLTAVQQGANVVISWTGDGVLQSTDSLSPENWKDVSPAPVGKTLTVTPGPGATRLFYSLR